MSDHDLIKPIFESAVLRTLQALILIRHPRLARRHWRYDGRRTVPNPALPSTANDKWFWRKIFDRSPVFVQITDKLGVRNWLTEHDIGLPCPKVLWVGDRAEDIPDEILADPVVIKTNHGCGTNIFLHGPPEDRDALDAKANEFMQHTHGTRELQWAYSKVVPKLFVEEFIPSMGMEFKIYCFGGQIERLIAIYDRFGETSADIWYPDENGELQRSDAATIVAKDRAKRPLPNVVAEALPYAREIGRHFDHIRVDVLSNGDNIWLGELTVYNLGGHFYGVAQQDLDRMNAAWDLRRSWFLTERQTGWRALYAKIVQDRLDQRASRDVGPSALSASIRSAGSAPSPRKNRRNSQGEILQNR